MYVQTILSMNFGKLVTRVILTLYFLAVPHINAILCSGIALHRHDDVHFTVSLRTGIPGTVLPSPAKENLKTVHANSSCVTLGASARAIGLLAWYTRQDGRAFATAPDIIRGQYEAYARLPPMTVTGQRWGN